MGARMKFCSNSYSNQLKNIISFTTIRRCSASSNVNLHQLDKKRNALFTQEVKRQHDEVGRIEKIEVNVLGPPENVTLVMNRDLSTPYECTRHISSILSQQAALAMVDSTTLWDMHRPLTNSCTLSFLKFKDPDPKLLNKAFWRSCSIILGAVISNAFKDTVTTTLHSFPSPKVRSGSFVYDAALSLSDWNPTEDELRILSAEMISFVRNNYKFERLQVNEELALEIMEGNEFKQEQIPKIAEIGKGKVTLYRLGNHIDISCGPLIGDTSFVGRCTITAVHKIATEKQNLYRFQGVALPKGIMLNHYAYSIIEQRARKLNAGLLPDSEEYKKRVDEMQQPRESSVVSREDTKITAEQSI